MIEQIFRSEVITTDPALALAGLLDVDEPADDDALPLLWHWLYLLERPRQAALGEDGHPFDDCIPAPPGPGRRRMFAGGRVRLTHRLEFGAPATRTTFVRSTQDKSGRSGRLTFVTVAHELRSAGRLVIAEEQDIVYRDAVDAPGSGGGRTDPPVGAVDDGASVVPSDSVTIRRRVDPVLLFRFSALTYNAHRIHYDRDYATAVEGHPGLVVHGPLQAILMAETLRTRIATTGRGVQMSYRLRAPLFDTAGELIARGDRTGTDTFDTSIRDSLGNTTATGRIELI